MRCFCCLENTPANSASFRPAHAFGGRPLGEAERDATEAFLCERCEGIVFAYALDMRYKATLR